MVLSQSRDQITRLLNSWKGDESQQSAELVEYIWRELHRVAASMMRRERPGHTLQATELVSEAYIRLLGPENWKNRSQFFAVAATTMRRVLVDHARKRKALKRGEGVKVDLEEAEVTAPNPVLLEADEVLRLEAALQRLQEIDPRQAKIVEMRYYSGMTVAEVALALGISERTVKREWKHAKAWLLAELSARKD